MANPTTNFGWVMPTSSSLVTNLPADFNTFGQAVDTSMSELLGGTTGQVLSKTSNTNMDFTWITPTDQTPLTTKGDLFTFTTVDARLGVGANDTVLTADSTAATGLKWAAPASGGGMTLLSTTSLSGVSGVTLSGTLTGYNNLQLVIRNPQVASGGQYVGCRFNADTGANYTLGFDTFAATNLSYFDNASTSVLPQQNSISGSTANMVFVFDIYNINGTSSFKAVRMNTYEVGFGTGTARIQNGAATWRNSAAITSVSVQNIAATNWTSGDALLYGVK